MRSFLQELLQNDRLYSMICIPKVGLRLSVSVLRNEQGDAAAQYNLGFMYSKGLGVAQDYRQAAKWFQKAAEQGFAWAQANLGVLYYNGQGVKKI